jgi:recombination protein RecR
MTGFPASLERLVQLFARLPGIGRKSATRMALKLLASSEAECAELAGAIVHARTRTIGCAICGGLTEDDPCSICSDVRRDSSVVCVVERPSDILALERTGRFRGRYHVLGGLLSPLDGIGPENLRIDQLLRRLEGEAISETILALNPTAEGEATALYLARLLAQRRIKVTKLASGLPVGGDLDLADELTLGTALDERRPV